MAAGDDGVAAVALIAARGGRDGARARVGALALSLALAALIIAALAGCGGGDEPESTPEPSPTPVSPAALLAESGAAMGALRSFRFSLAHNRDGTPLADNLTVTSAEGAVVSPDKISVDFSGTFGSFAIRSGIVSIGADSYMTNPLSGEWESAASGVSPLAFFDPQSGVGAMMRSVENPTLASASDDAFVVAGDLAVSVLAPILGGAATDGDVRAELTIAADTRLLEKAVIEGRVTADETDGLIRTIELWDFDAPISIEPPSSG